MDFTARALTLAVNQMVTCKTPVLDKVFKRKKRQLSSTFSWDVKSATNQLLANIAGGAEASVRGGVGRKNITCTAPRFAEKELISANDLADMRKFGSAQEPELLKERIGDEQFDMKNNVDLTREFMAVKALSGVVVDKDGTELVNFNLPGELKPTLSGAALWSDAASDPIANIRKWQKLISRSVGGGVVSSWEAFCGSGVMDALINNESVLDKLKFVGGKQIADEGRIAYLAGTNIEEYLGFYRDAAGAAQEMIPDDVFALVGIVSDGAAELFAPVVDLDAPGGVGKGKKADMFFSKQWDVKDPSGKWVKVEARPLPVLTRICVVWATVV